MNGRARVLGLLDGQETDRVPLMPVTMMLAADEISAPYRDYARDYRVLARGQIATAHRYDLDHVSAISDPCREASDLGAEIEYFDDRPPAILERRALLADRCDLVRLAPPDPLAGSRMRDRVEAIALLTREVGDEKVVEGWVEGPCALAANLRGISVLMLDLFDDPPFARDLLAFSVEVALRFAGAQIAAGADLIGIGDAAASLVGPRFYEEWVFASERALVDGIHEMGARVRLHICGRTRKLLPAMGRLGADIVDLDWMVPLAEARQQMSARQVLLGNIDPVAVLRRSSPRNVTEALQRCHREAGQRWIAGAGCEVVRDTPRANLDAMRAYARLHRRDGTRAPSLAIARRPRPNPESFA